MVARRRTERHRPSPRRSGRGDDVGVDGLTLRRLDPALRARFFDLQAACGGWCFRSELRPWLLGVGDPVRERAAGRAR
jgi:hypothetical protein